MKSIPVGFHDVGTFFLVEFCVVISINMNQHVNYLRGSICLRNIPQISFSSLNSKIKVSISISRGSEELLGETLEISHG